MDDRRPLLRADLQSELRKEGLAPRCDLVQVDEDRYEPAGVGKAAGGGRPREAVGVRPEKRVISGGGDSSSRSPANLYRSEDEEAHGREGERSRHVLESVQRPGPAHLLSKLVKYNVSKATIDHQYSAGLAIWVSTDRDNTTRA